MATIHRRSRAAALVLSLLIGGGAIAAEPPQDAADRRAPTDRFLELAQSYSCSPRRYCSRNISSCQEARWYYQNCSWGGALDGDNDGRPCENLC